MVPKADLRLGGPRWPRNAYRPSGKHFFSYTGLKTQACEKRKGLLLLCLNKGASVYQSPKQDKMKSLQRKLDLKHRKYSQERISEYEKMTYSEFRETRHFRSLWYAKMHSVKYRCLHCERKAEVVYHSNFSTVCQEELTHLKATCRNCARDISDLMRKTVGQLKSESIRKAEAASRDHEGKRIQRNAPRPTGKSISQMSDTDRFL